MFQALFRRAQATVEITIEHAVVRMIMVVPFLIAGGFGAAALAHRLNAEFGPEVGNMIMAALFIVIGLVTVAVMSIRNPPVTTQTAADTKPLDDHPVEPAAASAGITDTDRELIAAALASLAPVAVPQILRMVVKNLPLLAAVGAAVFLVTRPTARSSNSSNDEVPSFEPADEPLRAAA